MNISEPQIMFGLEPVDPFDFHWLPYHRLLSPQTVI